MEIKYNNLYIHFIFTTINRLPLITEKNRNRIEKYITGIIKNNDSQLYAVYANPEHVHFLASVTPTMSLITLATIVADSSQRFINENKLCAGRFEWQRSCAAFQSQKVTWTKFANTFSIKKNTTAERLFKKNMMSLSVIINSADKGQLKSLFLITLHSNDKLK